MTIPVRLHSDSVQESTAIYEIDEPVVELMGHTLLLRRVSLNINNVSDFVDCEVARQVNRPMFCIFPVDAKLHKDRISKLTFELPFEHVPGTGTVTEGMRHFELR